MSESNSDDRVYLTVDPREINFPNLDQLVKTAQIIVVALVIGLVFFTGFTLLDFDGFEWQPDMLTWIALGCMLAAIPLSSIVPLSIVTAQVRTELQSGNSADPTPALYEKFFGFFLVRLILGCATLEGAGFLNAIAFNLGKNPLSLVGVAVAVCIALILAKFPSKWQAQKWIAACLQR